MAAATVTITPDAQVGENRAYKLMLLTGTLVIVAGDYVTGGLDVDIAAAHRTGSSNALMGCILSPNNVVGFLLEWDNTNKKLKIRVEAAVGTNTPLAQHTAVALDASLIGPVINYFAWMRAA